MTIPETNRKMTPEEIVDCRRRGWTIKEIIAEGANSDKEIYAVLRAAGLCRDQRPEREYVVTVMVPEFIRVRAQSPAAAKIIVRKEFNENARVTSVDEA